jgi:hypothetical protein
VVSLQETQESCLIGFESSTFRFEFGKLNLEYSLFSFWIKGG